MPYTVTNMEELERLLRVDTDPQEVLEVAGEAVQEQLQDYLKMLDDTKPNKMGGDRTHFYQKEAEGTRLEILPNEADVVIPDPYSVHVFGAHIEAKDKLLTVPARAEAHGHRAKDFDLYFGMYATGSKFLAEKGTDLLMFWLCESVDIPADPEALPPVVEMEERAAKAVETWWLREL